MLNNITYEEYWIATANCYCYFWLCLTNLSFQRSLQIRYGAVKFVCFVGV